MLNSKSSRPGQVTSQFKDIPVFCHLKRVNLADGDTLLEINYIFCFAYNGPYRVAGVNTGMHDGDWEHITVRCTTDGRLVAGVSPLDRITCTTHVAIFVVQLKHCVQDENVHFCVKR